MLFFAELSKGEGLGFASPLKNWDFLSSTFLTWGSLLCIHHLLVRWHVPSYGWVELSAPAPRYLPYMKVIQSLQYKLVYETEKMPCSGLLGTYSLHPLSSLFPYLANFLPLHHVYFLQKILVPSSLSHIPFNSQPTVFSSSFLLPTSLELTNDLPTDQFNGQLWVQSWLYGHG